jgi:hypothetical protein
VSLLVQLVQLVQRDLQVKPAYKDLLVTLEIPVKQVQQDQLDQLGQPDQQVQLVQLVTKAPWDQPVAKETTVLLVLEDLLVQLALRDYKVEKVTKEILVQLDQLGQLVQTLLSKVL